MDQILSFHQLWEMFGHFSFADFTLSALFLRYLLDHLESVHVSLSLLIYLIYYLSFYICLHHAASICIVSTIFYVFRFNDFYFIHV